MDQELARVLLSCQTENSFETVLGTTMCTDDFYEGVGGREGGKGREGRGRGEGGRDGGREGGRKEEREGGGE